MAKTESIFKELTADEIALGIQRRKEDFEHDKATWIAVAQKEGKFQVARNLKKLGMSDEDIAAATELHLEEVKEITPSG